MTQLLTKSYKPEVQGMLLKHFLSVVPHAWPVTVVYPFTLPIVY